MKILIIVLVLLSGCSPDLYCVNGKLYQEAADNTLRELDINDTHTCEKKERLK